MKVYVYPADVYGCGFYRLIWAAEQLIRDGHDIEIVMPEDNRLYGHMDKNGNTISVTAPKDADVMVMQRITSRNLAQAIPLWRKKGIAVVMDLDDDLAAIHPANPAWKALHPRQGSKSFDWRVAENAARDVSLLTVSTPELARRYAPHGRVAVFDNYIPQSYLDIEHRDSEVIGWGGSIASHPHDFEVIGHALARVVDDGAYFRVVGPDYGVPDATRIKRIGAWSATGSIDLSDWPCTLAYEIGIGIAPLADTRFNAAKSRLKPLEYAALGIPTLMSPRAEYQKLHELGIGKLCSKPKDWERALRLLIKEPSLREDISIRGRQICEGMTIERNAHVVWSAWEEALRLQRKTLPAHAS